MHHRMKKNPLTREGFFLWVRGSLFLRDVEKED